MAKARIPIELINSRLPQKSKLKAVEYIERHVSKGGVTRSVVRCKCSCGAFKNCIVADLIRGNPIACGTCKVPRIALKYVLPHERKNAVLFDYNGKQMTIPQISLETGILQSVLKARIKSGKAIYEATMQNSDT